jgi:hypothetical protein
MVHRLLQASLGTVQSFLIASAQSPLSVTIWRVQVVFNDLPLDVASVFVDVVYACSGGTVDGRLRRSGLVRRGGVVDMDTKDFEVPEKVALV